jgi:scyllo-inositol 2-dehydrogenase (NADP+)
MRVIVAGLGVQGYKRRRIADKDFVADVDPVITEARYRSIVDVPLADYDAVLACIPDEPKIELLTY